MVIQKSDSDSAEITADFLKKKSVVLIPTDTVYGFSGIVPETEGTLRQIKGREETKPFIRLIADPEEIISYSAAPVPESILKFWPGALTVIVAEKNAPGSTAAFRCPGDPWLRKVIFLCGKPIYSTSCNRSGQPQLFEIAEIKKEFASEVSLIVDGGMVKKALPSTLIDISDGSLRILRQGSLEIPELLLDPNYFRNS